MATPTLTRASDHSFLVSFGGEISLPNHDNVVRLTTLLLTNRREFIRNVHPAYCSVLVSFNPGLMSPAEIEEYLVSLIQQIESTPRPPQRRVEVPVCYGGEFGPDLADVAAQNHCSPDDVVRIHASGEYLVYFLGFSPGFPYMGGLSPKIATPRLATPRRRVLAGSVAIGGNQTGIYPVNSPGGWRIIGRTPLRLFRPDEQPPVLFQMGDVIRFVPITEEEFARRTSD